jgi:tryptophan synthase alpha chain
MTLINKTFTSLKERNEGGLIGYITAGDPYPLYTTKIAEALIKGGVDIIELGIPFSDPIADGRTIQSAIVRALNAGTTPNTVLRIARQIKTKNKIPIVILTYYNPIFRKGLKKFFQSAKNSGIDGIIVPDLPIEEAHEYKELAKTYEVDTIFLAAPSTSNKRLKKIVEYTSGFLYLVSVFGVTGARDDLNHNSVKLISRISKVTSHNGTPLAVGFGISKPQHIKTVLKNGANAAIVGSAFVNIIKEKMDHTRDMLKTLEKYTSDLKQATRKLH